LIFHLDSNCLIVKSNGITLEKKIGSLVKNLPTQKKNLFPISIQEWENILFTGKREFNFFLFALKNRPILEQRFIKIK
jgi:hypothetical protein